MKLLLAPSNKTGVGMLVKDRVVSSSLCVLCCCKLPSNRSQRLDELKVNVGVGADCWLEGSGCCFGCVYYYKELGLLWLMLGCMPGEAACFCPGRCWKPQSFLLGVFWEKHLPHGAALLPGLMLSTVGV